MGKEIIQSSKIRSGKFQLIIKETPLSKPDSYIMDSGLLLSEIINKIPEGKGSVYVNGLQCIDSDYRIESGNVVEVVISPNEAVSAATIITAILASLAGAALGYFLFKPPAPDGDGQKDDFSRISGLRNSERRYEPTGLVLGKRKVAPYYISRPYTLIEGNEEYFYALLSVGYGPLKLSNPRIGETPLSEFEHEITYLDHFENTSVEDLYNAYNADISQETVNQLLSLDDPYTIRSVGTGSNFIDLDFLWPAGSYRITRSKGRTRAHQSSVRIDFEQGGIRYTVIRVVNQSSDIVGGVYNTGSGWRIKTQNGDQSISVSRSFGSYVLVTGLNQNVIAASVFHSSPDKKQIAKSISIPVDSELPTTVYVKKQFPTQDIVDEFNPVSEIQWMNLKSRRPLNFEKFKKGMGSERPLLRYEGGPVNGVETYRPVVIALKLRATAQLNGTLDNFFIDAEMCVPQDKTADWRNWPSLTLEPSNNPADAYKWLLQGPANYSALPNNKIDNISLEDWRQTCINEEWAISDYLTTESTLLDEMKNVAFVGRAEFSFRDGKFGVVEKVEKTLPVQMFTNKNSASFQSARNYPEEVDGIKFEFDNAEIDYEKDEATFLDPVKAANPTQLKGKFQRVTLRGVDNYEQAYRLARFFYYETALQRETYKLKTDIEGLRCNRGDLVYIQNDIIRVSLGSGRIKSINGSTVVIDEQVGLEDRIGDQLGFVIRDKQGNFFFEAATYNGNGQWECDLPNSSGVGDLVIYGESGSETLECIVRDIDYDEELNVSLTLVNAANILYQRDDDFIPEFESNVTPPTEIEIPQAPVIYETPSVNLDTNEVTLTLLNTSNNRMEGIFYTVQQRSYLATSSEDTSTEWETVATGIQGNIQFNVGNLQQGYVYQFRVQARRSNSTFSAWSNIATVEIEFGREMPDITNIGFFHELGGTVLTWDRIENPFLDGYEIRLDDQFGAIEDEDESLSDPNLVALSKSNSLPVGYLTANTAYYVAAKNTQGRYGNVSQITVTPPAVNPVVNLVTNNPGDEDSFIAWDEPVQNYAITGYEIKRNLSGEAPNELTAVKKGLINATYFNVTENLSGTYPYWVATRDASGRISDWMQINVEVITVFGIIEESPIFGEILDELDERIEKSRQRIEKSRQRVSDARVDIIEEIGGTLKLSRESTERRAGFIEINENIDNESQARQILGQQLFAELETVNGEILATNSFIQFVDVKVDGVAESVTLIDSRVTDVEGETEAISDLILASGLDEDGNTTATSSLNSRLESAEGEIISQSQLILDVEVRVGGTESSIASLSSRVGNVEGETEVISDLILASGLDEDGNTTATSSLNARLEDAEGEIASQSQLILDVDNRVDGTVSSIASLTSRVGDVEGLSSDSAEAILTLNTDTENLKARAALTTELQADGVARVTGVVIQDDGMNRDIEFIGDSVRFTDGNNVVIFFDLNEQKYKFSGILEASELRGGTITGNVVNTGTVTGGRIQTSSGAGFRTVISPSDGYAFWYGSGAVNNNNGIVYFDTNGNAVFKGELGADTVTATALTTDAIDGKVINGVILRGGSFSVSQANNTGFFTYIDSTPFGTTNDLVEWYGQKVNGVTWNNSNSTPRPQGMSKINSLSHKTINGSVFFGGTFQAGTLSLARQSTTTSGSLIVNTDPFTIPSGTTTLVIASSVNVTGSSQLFSGQCPNVLPTFSLVVNIERLVSGQWQNIGGNNTTVQVTCNDVGGERQLEISGGVTVNTSLSVSVGQSLTLRATATAPSFPFPVDGINVDGSRSLSLVISGGE